MQQELLALGVSGIIQGGIRCFCKNMHQTLSTINKWILTWGSLDILARILGKFISNILFCWIIIAFDALGSIAWNFLLWKLMYLL